MRIGDGVWLSSRVIVLPGVVVGDGAVVAAGAVVTSDVAPNTLVAGIPARPLRALDRPPTQADRLVGGAEARDSSELPDDPRRHAGGERAGRDVLDHDAAGGDAAVLADGRRRRGR